MKIGRIEVDGRPTIALAVGYPDDPKVIGLGDAARALGAGEVPWATMREFITAGGESFEFASAVCQRALESGFEGTSPADVRWLPPIDGPLSVVCAGRNFGKHLEESQGLLAKQEVHLGASGFPTGFAKLPGVLVGHMAQVAMPPGVSQLDYEIEVAAVLGPPVREGLKPIDRVFGFTPFNDLSDREMQLAEMQSQLLLTGKNRPGFGPIGPWITTRDEVSDPNAILLQLRVNDEVRQDSSTADMLFSFDELIDFWSRIPLEAGDVITSGSPDGVAIGREDPSSYFLRSGDRIDADVGELGTLTTFIE